MIRAVIADDEPPARSGLRSLLRATGRVEVVGEAANGPAAVDLVRRARPDAVFLDVQMPGLDGLTVAAAVARRPAPAIVFVTAYAHHAPRAFELEALDYLVKPFEQRRLSKCVDRLERFMRRGPHVGAVSARVSPSTASRVAIREAGRLHFVHVDDVLWAEARGNYVRLHTVAEMKLVRGTMGAVLSRLGNERFVRIGRSAAVAADSVRELLTRPGGGYTVTLDNGLHLRVSRRYASAVARALAPR